MAAPQSFVPPRVTPSRPKQRFTVEQANRTLPLVSRIVADIVKTHTQFVTLQAQSERLSAGSKKQLETEKELQVIKERLHSLVEELNSVGCDIKDFQMGLVDFVGRNQGRDVCLCWKLGESEVGFWHELDAGYPGRQPVSTLKETE
jgi:hypothetical protein